ncbi:MAG: hypothetical protein R3F37_18455 [Candidatus Competibacteraceae bacterium]
MLISEPLAYRQELSTGSLISLPTPNGSQEFPIVGVFLDYGSEHGRILLSRQLYERFWDDRAFSTAAAYVAPGVDLDELRQRLEQRIGPLQELILRSNRDIQDFTLAVFDRNFYGD